MITIMETTPEVNYFAHLRRPTVSKGGIKCDFHSVRSPGLTKTIFELNSCIKETNVLTKLHKNWAKNVTSKVLTCFHYIHNINTGGHVFSPIRTIVELVQDINKTDILTNFHDDWAKIVTFRFAHLRGFHDDWAKNVTSSVHVIQLTGTIFKLNSHIKKTNVLTKFHENWAKNVTSSKNAPPTGGHVFHRSGVFSNMVRDINKTNVLANFHDDWAKIVTSRVFTSYVIQLTGTIFELNSHIKETNVLTKFHENWAKNMTSRVFPCFHFIHLENNAPPTGGHVFSPIWTTFEVVRDINKTNVLNNFHDDWAKNVTSSVYVIQLTGTIFDLNSHIKETNVLTKFHENLAKNVTSRVFTCFHYIHIEKNDPPTGGYVISPIWTIFVLVRDINKTNVLANFHDYWAKIVTSRVFTRKTAPPPPGSHVIQLTGTIFELNSHIKETNVLTKFHEHWAKNVTSRVFTCFHYIHIEKNAPPTGGHVFSPIWTIFELVRVINKTNVLTNFHDDWAKIVTFRVLTRKTASPPRPCSHVIQLTGTIFELNSYIKETNVLTKFHENWAKNVTSRKNAPPTGGHVFFTDINKTNVLTNFHDDWAKIVTSRVFTRKTVPPTGGHVFQWTGTTFELNLHIIKANILTNFELDRDFIGTKLLTKFHEDRTINVASRVFMNKCGRTDRRRTKTGHKSSPEKLY
ncbi:hypothetical protein DPMN_107945 [Dreissena polymorpha]|uniref:Uncharacterized protein n=1 Tax=Dreissena polymorpha TaxID=45954 RepID=A0A9D4QKM9_DREPO|nr:hypothetical protein DPMN_107945 [Dreissena polymorpha]